MSNKQQNRMEDQEIDLNVLSEKVSQGIDNISGFFYRIILFIKKRIIILLGLFFLGIGLSYYLEQNMFSYKHELTVIQNFDSSDYLYSKIDLLNSKISERDETFFKNIGISGNGNFVYIEAEPIIDIYNFINEKNTDLTSILNLNQMISQGVGINQNTNQNYNLLRLLAEKGDVNGILQNKVTSDNYKRHLIKIKTNQKQTDLNDLITPILNYLNNNEYFKSVQKLTQENLKSRIQTDEQTIKQIDEFLNNIPFKQKESYNNVKFMESNQIASIVVVKNGLVEELELKKIGLLNSDKIIKEINHSLNNKTSDFVFYQNKLSLSFIFMGLFLFASYLVSFYKRQTAKHNL